MSLGLHGSAKAKGRGYSLCIVLDTSAFLAKYPLQIYSPDTTVFTVPAVISEIRDEESRRSLELILALNRVAVKEPSASSRRNVYESARRLGEHVNLSKTDIDVIALALELTSLCRKVVVFTDDYSIQNTLLYLGIPFKPIKTIGIKELRRYSIICPTCGYVPADLTEEKCPICGSKLRRIRRR